jgi:hypothetical protein
MTSARFKTEPRGLRNSACDDLVAVNVRPNNFSMSIISAMSSSSTMRATAPRSFLSQRIQDPRRSEPTESPADFRQRSATVSLTPSQKTRPVIGRCLAPRSMGIVAGRWRVRRSVFFASSRSSPIPINPAEWVLETTKIRALLKLNDSPRRRAPFRGTPNTTSLNRQG